MDSASATHQTFQLPLEIEDDGSINFEKICDKYQQLAIKVEERLKKIRIKKIKQSEN